MLLLLLAALRASEEQVLPESIERSIFDSEDKMLSISDSEDKMLSIFDSED